MDIPFSWNILLYFLQFNACEDKGAEIREQGYRRRGIREGVWEKG